MPATNVKPYRFYASPEQIAAIKVMAKTDNLTRAALIRTALSEYAYNHGHYFTENVLGVGEWERPKTETLTED